MLHQDRAVAFIDEANFAKQAEEIGYRVDYPRLSAYLLGKYNLVRAYLYSGMDLSQPQFKSFALFIKRSGFRMVNRRGAVRSDGSFKSDIDVILAVDMVSMCDWYDTAILLSADGDFAPALEAVSRKGVRVEVISRKDRTAEALVDLADRLIDLNEIVTEIGYSLGPAGGQGAAPLAEGLTTLEDDEAAKALFVEVLQGIEADSLPYRLGDLNTTMKKADSNFDIKRTSFRKFSALAEFFQQQGAIKIGLHADGTQALDELDLAKLGEV